MKPCSKVKLRHGVELGKVLSGYCEEPPYIPRGQKPGFRWTAKLLASKVNVTPSAVRQWWNGSSLPSQCMPSIISAIFGTEVEKFDKEISDLWQLLRRSERRRDRHNDETNAPITQERNAAESSFVPHPTVYFVGRDEERDKLAQVLVSSELSAILIQGGPGIGKTELTKAIAHHPDIIARFGERRYFVPLEIASGAEAMQHAVIRSIGCDPQYGFAAALNTLRGQQTLIVLDNLESPWESFDQRQLVEEMLAEIGQIEDVALLASIRGYEWVGGPSWHHHRVEPMIDEWATKLFASIAGQAIVDDPHLGKFIGELGGIPLAIQLVARRAYGRNGLAPLWNEWLRIGTELASRPGFEAGRLTSLDHSIELSLRSPRMTPAWRVFRLLGCLPDGLAEPDAIALLEGTAFAAWERLCHLGLGIEARDRLTMLPPIRDYAQRHYPPEAEDADRWAAYYASAVADLYEAENPLRESGKIYRLFPDRHNIEAALRSRITTESMTQLDAALAGYAVLTSLTNTATDLFLDAAMFYRRLGDRHSEALCMQSHAELALNKFDHATAADAYSAALHLFRAIPDREQEAACIAGLADVAMLQGAIDQAIVQYTEARDRAHAVGNTAAEAKCNTRLGEIALRTGNFSEAHTAFLTSLRLLDEIDLPMFAATNWMGLGEVALFASQNDEAEANFRKAFPLYQEAGHLQGIAMTHLRLGDVKFARGQFKVAYENYLQALPALRSFDDASVLINCLQSFGNAALRVGDVEAADAAFIESLAICREISHPHGIAVGTSGRAEVALARGDVASAHDGFLDALARFDETGWILGVANSLCNLAECALVLEDFASAREYFQRAALQYRVIDSLQNEAYCTGRLLYLQ